MKIACDKHNIGNQNKRQLTWKKVTQDNDTFLEVLITCGVSNSNTGHATDFLKANSYTLYGASMILN